jgi:hypothetical protein
MAYGKLQLVVPGGAVREIPIEMPSLLVGRAQENHVVIDHPSVSRRHARLSIDSGRLMVEDFGSTGGTFVGGQQIEPNSPHLVEDGQSLRFGSVEGIFIPEGRAAPAAGSGPPQSSPAGAGAQAGPAPRVQAVLASPGEPISPGSIATATLSLRNLSRVVDELTISVPDLPPEWVRVSRTSVSLLPAATDEVPVLIQPPRDPSALAGTRMFTVVVHSREQGTDVEAVGSITIQPFGQLTVSLQPSRAKRDFRVVAENGGNEPLTLALKGIDDEEALDYEFASESVTIPPGAHQTVALKVRTRKRKITGAPLVKPFRVEARPASTRAAPVLADGALQSEPPLASWKWPLAGLLLVGVAGGGVVGYTQACPDGLSECIGSGDSGGDGGGSAGGALSQQQTATALAAASPSPGSTTTPSPSASAAPSASPSPSPSPSPSSSPSPSPSASATPKPSPSPSPAASPSPSPTATRTPTRAPTRIPLPN